MSNTGGVKKDIAHELLKKFPKSGVMTLARIAYQDNPGVYTSVAEARSNIQYHAGRRAGAVLKGKGSMSKDKTLHKVPGGQKVWTLPESWYEAPKEHKLPIGCRKVLWLCDFQNPFICHRSIDAAFEFGVNKGVQAVILNGDVFDHFATSRHEKNPRKIDWKKERELNIELLENVRKAFPDAVIWFKDGNHEKNLIKYMMVQAPVLYRDEFHNIAEFYQLDKYRIKSITGNDTIKVGDLTGWHGDEFMGNGGNVNPAKNYFDKVRTNVVVSHVHKSSTFITQDYYGKKYKAYTLGALCGLKPQWMSVNQWNNGWGYQEVDPSGEFDFMNVHYDALKNQIIIA